MKIGVSLPAPKFERGHRRAVVLAKATRRMTVTCVLGCPGWTRSRRPRKQGHLSPSGVEGKPLVDSALPFLGAVQVRVSVRIGSLQATVAELLKTKTGDVLTLDRLVDQPLDVLVDEHVIARGMLVAVDDHFGVRITEAVGSLPGTKK